MRRPRRPSPRRVGHDGDDGGLVSCMPVSLVRINPEEEREALVEFMTTNTFPFHGVASITRLDVVPAIDDGRYRNEENDSYWILDDRGRRVGLLRFEDLGDDTPLFDLRLADDQRGRGLGRAALQAAAQWVFTTRPGTHRFEGNTRADNLAMRRAFLSCGWVKEAHYRRSWPTADGEFVDGVAYAILRHDWETGETTPVPWDDTPHG